MEPRPVSHSPLDARNDREDEERTERNDEVRRPGTEASRIIKELRSGRGEPSIEGSPPNQKCQHQRKSSEAHRMTKSKDPATNLVENRRSTTPPPAKCATQKVQLDPDNSLLNPTKFSATTATPIHWSASPARPMQRRYAGYENGKEEPDLLAEVLQLRKDNAELRLAVGRLKARNGQLDREAEEMKRRIEKSEKAQRSV